ncbi:MAG: hypothetical protein AVDCRST_MAG36-2898, partial [uncultured Nocardioidaceae bacterium]
GTAVAHPGPHRPGRGPPEPQGAQRLEPPAGGRGAGARGVPGVPVHVRVDQPATRARRRGDVGPSGRVHVAAVPQHQPHDRGGLRSVQHRRRPAAVGRGPDDAAGAAVRSGGRRLRGAGAARAVPARFL